MHDGGSCSGPANIAVLTCVVYHDVYWAKASFSCTNQCLHLVSLGDVYLAHHHSIAANLRFYLGLDFLELLHPARTEHYVGTGRGKCARDGRSYPP